MGAHAVSFPTDRVCTEISAFLAVCSQGAPVRRYFAAYARRSFQLPTGAPSATIVDPAMCPITLMLGRKALGVALIVVLLITGCGQTRNLRRCESVYSYKVSAVGREIDAMRQNGICRHETDCILIDNATGEDFNVTVIFDDVKVKSGEDQFTRRINSK